MMVSSSPEPIVTTSPASVTKSISPMRAKERSGIDLRQEKKRG
jgi:hypothetical protein